jgi:hypothetical protein
MFQQSAVGDQTSLIIKIKQVNLNFNLCFLKDDEVKYSPATTSHEVLREENSYVPVDIGTAKANETYEVVYEDLPNDKSLQEAKDNEARSHLKEKVCRLGLAKEVRGRLVRGLYISTVTFSRYFRYI